MPQAYFAVLHGLWNTSLCMFPLHVQGLRYGFICFGTNYVMGWSYRLKLLGSLSTGTETRPIILSGSLSELYTLRCGVRREGLTSPKLFNLYVNALTEELGGTNVGCSLDSTMINNKNYAVDMVLLSSSICALRMCANYAVAQGIRKY